MTDEEKADKVREHFRTMLDKTKLRGLPEAVEFFRWLLDNYTTEDFVRFYDLRFGSAENM